MTSQLGPMFACFLNPDIGSHVLGLEEGRGHEVSWGFKTKATW